MVLIILAIWFGYKKARDSGRNKFLWAAISGGVFLGVQFLVGIAFGVFIVIGQQLLGWREDSLERYQIFATIPAIIFSVLALWLVFRFLDRVPAETPHNRSPTAAHF
jgi:uncharacterized BrkB/YihY/UPF0761 family membrane protein